MWYLVYDPRIPQTPPITAIMLGISRVWEVICAVLCWGNRFPVLPAGISIWQCRVKTHGNKFLNVSYTDCGFGYFI